MLSSSPVGAYLSFTGSWRWRPSQSLSRNSLSFLRLRTSISSSMSVTSALWSLCVDASKASFLILTASCLPSCACGLIRRLLLRFSCSGSAVSIIYQLMCYQSGVKVALHTVVTLSAAITVMGMMVPRRRPLSRPKRLVVSSF